jgi:hypothetical protein
MVEALFAADFVVFSSFDKGRAQDAVQLVTVGLLVYPLAYGVEYVSVDFDALVPECRVVESAEDVVHYFFDGDARVLPGVDNSRSNVLENGSGNSTSHTVQFIGEVILREHRVSWVCTVSIIPWFELLIGTNRHLARIRIIKRDIIRLTLLGPHRWILP